VDIAIAADISVARVVARPLRSSTVVTRRSKRGVCCFAAAAGFTIGAASSPASADKTVYYTDSCVERESGDIGGYVVIVSDGKPFPVIQLSWSEGALKQPVAARVTNYDRGSGQLSFQLRSNGMKVRRAIFSSTARLQLIG
ncbi:hypothetical protein, partial [Bradyrhizobium oropedii]|uniref:hypothetical protein n=1 Tax=Bradyrhizobium oropedii TaxID=1571201 RepID=UPI001E41FE0C